MRPLVLVLTLASLGTAAAEAQIAVRILGMPSEVHSFEPVYVLYAVYNEGTTPVLLPNGSAPLRGSGVYVAPRGERPESISRLVSDSTSPGATSSMWLAPGERWLYYRNIAWDLSALEGDFEVQAVLSSAGGCIDQLTGGRSAFPMESLYLETVSSGTISARLYRCWEGEVRSEQRRLSVVRSRDPVDEQAFEFLVQKHYLVRHQDGPTEWTMPLGSLGVTTFPASHFSYAALTQDESQVASLMRAVELQPSNPLNPWVRGALGRRVIDYRSSCWSGQRLAFDLDLATIEVPAGVGDYLAQYAWEVENRRCPLELDGSKTKPAK